MRARHRAIDITRPGGPEVLALKDVDTPQPAAQQLLIEVHAAGVNRADLKQREGNYVMPAGASSVPGLEVCGVVAACGAGATRFKPGDKVCALVIDGGYAQYVACPEVQCLPLPAGLSFAEGAALPEAVFTVWMSVFEQARLGHGETFLVHGGASGIGTAAIQMARAAGARVFATSGGAEKAAHCRRLGAELAVDYRQPGFWTQLREVIGERGVDVILDMVGAPYYAANLDLLATGGRICYIAGDEGRVFPIDLRPLMMKRATITGATLRHRTIADKGRLAAEIEKRVWPWVASGALKPQVGATFPLAQAAEAHRALAAGKIIGKAILLAR